MAFDGSNHQQECADDGIVIEPHRESMTE